MPQNVLDVRIRQTEELILRFAHGWETWINTAYVIAPEPGEGINKQTSYGVLLRSNLLISALIFSLLEAWRPYFFLTDDNLDGAFPFFTEMGQSLLAGRTPFVSHHLFGGDYNWLRDPDAFVWHPLYFLVSLFTATPLHNALVDIDAFFLFMLSTAGFVTLAHHLRREMGLKISDYWITFYTLSYTYTVIALTTGSSWLLFLGNISALPWLALGILQKSWWRGAGLVTFFCLHQFLGGHPSPTVSNTLFLSLFALGMSVSRRSWLPLGNWLTGLTAATVILLPLLVPMLEGFSTSYRAQGVPLSDMQANNVPVQDFPVSLLLGAAVWILHPHQHIYTTYTLAFGASAAAWCILPALVSRAKWRGLEVVSLGMLLIGALLITRPIFISQIMLHLPIVRSMRWPFREFVQFQFFFHLFLLVRPPGLTLPARRLSVAFGLCVFVIPLVLFRLPPTLNAMSWDRELILTGGSARYWDQVRPLLKPDDRIAVIIPMNLYTNDRFEEPYSLLGTYNYAILAGVVNAWGYSPTAARDQLYTKTYALYPFGAYVPEQKEALMAERPELRFITLESLHPVKISLSSKDGPTIDLTPYIPPRIAKDLGQPSDN